jgi:YVTN family beta-propeller protein
MNRRESSVANTPATAPHILQRRVPTAALGVLLAGWIAGCASSAPTATPTATGRVLATEYRQQNIGSFPVNIVLSADGRYAFTSDVGYRQAIHSLRTSDGVSVGHLDFPNRASASQPAGEATSRPAVRANRTNGLYYGLAVSGGRLYAAQGANDSILVAEIAPDGQLTQRAAIPTRPGDFPAGLAADHAGRLYVANQAANPRGDNPLTSTGSLAIYDPAAGKELGRYTFRDSYFGTSNFPLALTVTAAGGRVFVASERDNAVYVLDTRDPAHPALAATIAVGSHPEAVALTRDERRLYVANADSDTLSVINAADGTLADTILLRPATVKELAGCSPTHIALSADQHTAYVTLADMCAVAVVDLADAKVRGYLPTGWYPTSSAVAPDGRHLLVTAARGSLPHVPNFKFGPRGEPRNDSPLNVYEGVAQVVPIPRDLDDATAHALANARIDRPLRDRANPLQHISRQAGAITHVLYIIKENRTYDQVLGDLPQGNGDPKLCLFGRAVTPNQHALAERFVLLDNLYACGDVSGDGWVWSTQSMANAYVARNVPYEYSQRGRKFDFEGQNNGYPTGGVPATDPDGRPLATAEIFRNGAKPIPDVAEAGGGFLWDLCTKNGVSFRNYGFFGYFADEAAGVPGGPENYPSAKGLQPAGHNLDGLTDIDYRRFDMDFPDSDAPALLARETGDTRYLYDTNTYGKFATTSRFSEWNREFRLMLAKDPAGNAVPNLMFLRVPMDHTVGGRSGKHGPRAYIADNDYAVGQIVEAVSKSSIWPHCAIFVIEDDAQSGADHVDAHRTTGFVISPYIKAQSVDHRFYNTDSFLRTIELLLNLPPLTQYDATATPIGGWTGKPENAAPYVATMPDRAILAERNPEGGTGRGAAAPVVDPARARTRADLAAASDAMDFAHPDAAPAEELNIILWKLVKGVDSAPPAPRGSGRDED